MWATIKSKGIIQQQIFDDWSVSVYDNSLYGKEGYSTVIVYHDSSEMQDIDEYVYDTEKEAMEQSVVLLETELFMRQTHCEDAWEDA